MVHSHNGPKKEFKLDLYLLMLKEVSENIGLLNRIIGFHVYKNKMHIFICMLEGLKESIPNC